MIHNKIKLLAMIFMLPLTQMGMARSYDLTIEECRRMAIESNLRLKSSQERELMSLDMLSAYKSNRLPNFSLNGGYLYSPLSFTEVITGGYLPTYVPDATTGELVPNIAGTTASGETIFNSYAYMPDQSFELKIGSVYTAGVQVAQPIYMGGKISSAIKLAEIGVEASSLERRMSEAEVVEMVDKAFYELLKLEEMLTTATLYEEVVVEFLRQMQSGVNVGLKRKSELLKVEVKLSEARLMRQRAENGVRLSRMNFCYAVGLPLTTTDIKLQEAELDMEPLDSTKLDVSSRAEVALLEQQVAAREAELRITRSEFMPSLSAVASYNYLNGATINSNKLFSSANISAGVMANIPLFHWGEGRRKISAKRREITIAESEQEDMLRLMSLELLQSINSYNESIYELQLAEINVSQAQENMRECRSQYEAGMETVALYLEAQAMWQEALSRRCEVRAKMRVALIRYQRASGAI